MSTDFKPIAESDRRATLESEILACLAAHGGERIVAGPAMQALVREIADRVDARPDLARARVGSLDA